MAFGGYDLHWVEDPPDDLKCLICLCVARDPQQHPGDDNNDCGKIFCSECITKYQSRKTTCPNCRQNLSVFKDARSTRAIKVLRVRCNNETNGCDWMGELGCLETHLQSCDYALLPCTNQCMVNSVVAEFLRKNLPNHLTNDCPRRQYECPHCHETGEYQERTITHLDTCTKVKIPCPNPQCPVGIIRSEIPTHRSICKYELTSCKYDAVGCHEKIPRKDLKKHEENDQFHLRMTIEKVLELMEEFSLYKKQVKLHLYTFIFQVTSYHQKKNSDHIFYSPPFYTSYSGYKMCLSVEANGWGEGTGTHVSVFAHIMKGDHDDTLTWPFTGSVTVELLNQLEDKNHYKKTFTFPADGENSQRVVDDERGLGLGWSHFISHAGLDYNASTNIQYLKEDTLVFRVAAKVPNVNQKPWLECTM